MSESTELTGAVGESIQQSITPEMVEAGVEAFLRKCGHYPLADLDAHHIVRSVLKAASKVG